MKSAKGVRGGAASFAFLLFSSFVISSLFLSSIKTPPTSSLILPLPPSTLSSLALPLLNFSWLSAFFCSRSLSLSYPCPVSFMQKIRFIYQFLLGIFCILIVCSWFLKVGLVLFSLVYEKFIFFFRFWIVFIKKDTEVPKKERKRWLQFHCLLVSVSTLLMRNSLLTISKERSMDIRQSQRSSLKLIFTSVSHGIYQVLQINWFIYSLPYIYHTYFLLFSSPLRFSFLNHKFHVHLKPILLECCFNIEVVAFYFIFLVFMQCSLHEHHIVNIERTLGRVILTKGTKLISLNLIYMLSFSRKFGEMPSVIYKPNVQ